MLWFASCEEVNVVNGVRAKCSQSVLTGPAGDAHWDARTVDTKGTDLGSGLSQGKELKKR